MRAGDDTVFVWKRKRKSHGNRIFCVPQNGRVVFVISRLSYVVTRGLWCNIFLNAHAPNEEGDGSED